MLCVSEQNLLCTIGQFTSGPKEKRFQEKEKPEIPAGGKCNKAPDLRL